MDFDPHTHTGNLPSPCTKRCRIDPHSGWCEGCWRTLDEIGNWPFADEEARRAILTEIERRRTAP